MKCFIDKIKYFKYKRNVADWDTNGNLYKFYYDVDGKYHLATVIGYGAFSKAFKFNDLDIVALVTDCGVDISKEALTNLWKKYEFKYLPPIVKSKEVGYYLVDEYEGDSPIIAYCIYFMPYYKEKITDHSEYRELYQDLFDIEKLYRKSTNYCMLTEDYSNLVKFNRCVFEHMLDELRLPFDLKEELRLYFNEIIRLMKKYRYLDLRIKLDLMPDNLSVDKKGRLICRDCFATYY